MNYSSLHRSGRLGLLQCWLAELFFGILRFINRKKKILHPWEFLTLIIFKPGNTVKMWEGRWMRSAGLKGKDTQDVREILNWEIENVGCMVMQFQEFIISVNIPWGLRSDDSCWNFVLQFPICWFVGQLGHSYIRLVFQLFCISGWSQSWELTLS